MECVSSALEAQMKKPNFFHEIALLTHMSINEKGKENFVCVER